MTTTFHIHESEITTDFMKALKSMFRGKKLTVMIDTDEMDETEYLMSNPVNKERLLNSIKNIEKGINLKEMSFEDLKNLIPDA